MTEIGLFSTNLSNTAPSIGGLLDDKIEEGLSYTISPHLYTTGIGTYDGLVAKMLACGRPDKMGYVEYRCLQCGQGTHVVAMSCQSSLCLRCAKVYVDNWVSQVSKVLHEGVIYRHIILTVPAMFRTTFYHNAAVVLRAFIRCGAQCLDDF
jgi:hypothetical protein